MSSNQVRLAVHNVGIVHRDRAHTSQVGGFFNRLEASRKYLFGSVGVLGKANDSIISGAVILRGQDIEPVINVAPDWESYAYKKIDLSNADDKAFFEGAMAWRSSANGSCLPTRR